MRLKLVVLTLILVLMPCLVALAEDKNFEGEVTVGGTLPYVQGNTGKFNTYGAGYGAELKNGTISLLPSDVIAKFNNQKGYWMDFKATNPGYLGQSYDLQGGKYGSFKYDVYFKQIPHNQQWNAITPFYGAGFGGNNYSFFGVGANQMPTNTGNWNTIDYSIVRNQFGANISVDFFKPFYGKFGYTAESRTGTKVSGANDGGESPGGATELPLPVDYTTQGFNAEVGYGQKPFFAALSYYWQQFRNSNEFTYFRNPFIGNTSLRTPDVYTQAPDGDYQKLAFKGNAKLPYNTVFDVKGAWSQAKSSADLYNVIYETNPASPNTGNTVPTTLFNGQPTFNGKRDVQTYDVALTSRPWSFFDGKIYYKYYETKNKSDQILQTTATGSVVDLDDAIVNQLFDYWYQTIGADVNWRLAKSFTLFTGYQYKYQHQEREDIPSNKDNAYDIALKYSGLDWMTAKVGYQYFTRNGDHQTVPATPLNDDAVENYTYRYDLASQDRNTWKFDVTLSPLDVLNFTLGYRYAYVNYKDTTFGYDHRNTQAFKFDMDYTYLQLFKLYGYFDYEWSDVQQTQRRWTPTSATNQFAYDPFIGPTINSSQYNWQLKQTNKAFDFGGWTDIYIIPKKLTLRLQADYLRNNGMADFSYLQIAGFRNTNGTPNGRDQNNLDMAAWDDYYMQRYMIKLAYNFTPQFAMSGGYAYQQFRYSDAQYNDYRYVMPTTGAPNTFLSGYGNNPNYSANIYFMSASYKF